MVLQTGTAGLKTIFGVGLICVAIGIIAACLLPNSNLLSNQKLLLSAHQGDTVFIPCLNTPNQVIYQWNIQGSLYLLSQLSQEIESTAKGLILHQFTDATTGDYICYLQDGNHQLERISTVTLIVRTRDNITTTETDQGRGQDSETTELHLQVTEHDTIFIPCLPALGTNTVTIWSINGLLYPLLELPLYHTHHHDGIIVNNISTANDIYKCYSPINNTIQEMYTIRIGFQEAYEAEENPSTIQNYKRDLKLVGGSTSFNSVANHFQFRIVNVTPDIDYCRPGNVTFTMCVTRNNEILWTNQTSTYLPEFVIPSNLFQEEQSYAVVYSTNTSNQQCATLGYKIAVKVDANITFDGCVPEGNDVCCVQEGHHICAQLPKNLKGLVVIWPRTPNSDLDCVCGVFLPLSDIKFEDCYCLKGRLSPYNVTLINHQLCWMNLSRGTNDTKIVFARDIDQPEVDSTVRTFLSEIRITVEGPDPFLPSFNESSDLIFSINARSPDWSPVQRIGVAVYDSTGDLIKKEFALSNDTYLDLNDFPGSCAPFSIHAIAYTKCSESATATYSTRKGTRSSNCHCLEDKLVDLVVAANATDSDSVTLSLGIRCLNVTTYVVKNITNLSLEAVETDCTESCITNTSFAIQCDQNLFDVTVNNLKELTTYNLSVVWISTTNSSEICGILKKDIVLTTEKGQTSLEWYIIIGIVMGILAIVVLLAGDIVWVISAVNRKRKGHFRPQTHSRQEPHAVGH